MHLLLFGTSGCHLCEEAKEIIHFYLAENIPDVSIEFVDIADHEKWERYALKIPVLYHSESNNELFWPFDGIALNRFISSL